MNENTHEVISEEAQKLARAEIKNEIVRYWAMGWTNKKIADALNISVRTVSRTKNDPEYKKQYLMILEDGVRDLLPEAFTTLADIMTDQNSPATARVNCARTILEYSGMKTAEDVLAPKEVEIIIRHE